MSPLAAADVSPSYREYRRRTPRAWPYGRPLANPHLFEKMEAEGTEMEALLSVLNEAAPQGLDGPGLAGMRPVVRVLQSVSDETRRCYL